MSFKIFATLQIVREFEITIRKVRSANFIRKVRSANFHLESAMC
jgi:hypothetical protein